MDIGETFEAKAALRVLVDRHSVEEAAEMLDAEESRIQELVD